MKTVVTSRLSICIATYNRDICLDAMLERLVMVSSRSEYVVEIVIADGNSTDNTKQVVEKHQRCYDKIVYLKLPEKGGVDRDYDLAVRNARGDYVWLLTDDDLISYSAIDVVFNGIERYKPDLIVVNASCWNNDFSVRLNDCMYPCDSDSYIDDLTFHQKLFDITGGYLSYIGSLLIKRELWLSVNTTTFYGSRFIHMGVLSEIDSCSTVLIIAEPIVLIRLGNAEWSFIAFKIWHELWPEALSKFKGLSTESYNNIAKNTLKKYTLLVAFHRALGSFGWNTLQLNSIKSNIAKMGIAILFNLLPRQLFIVMFSILAMHRKDRVLSYNLKVSAKNRNKWHSTQ